MGSVRPGVVCRRGGSCKSGRLASRFLPPQERRMGRTGQISNVSLRKKDEGGAAPFGVPCVKRPGATSRSPLQTRPTPQRDRRGFCGGYPHAPSRGAGRPSAHPAGSGVGNVRPGVVCRRGGSCKSGRLASRFLPPQERRMGRTGQVSNVSLRKKDEGGAAPLGAPCVKRSRTTGRSLLRRREGGSPSIPLRANRIKGRGAWRGLRGWRLRHRRRGRRGRTPRRRPSRAGRGGRPRG